MIRMTLQVLGGTAIVCLLASILLCASASQEPAPALLAVRGSSAPRATPAAHAVPSAGQAAPPTVPPSTATAPIPPAPGTEERVPAPGALPAREIPLRARD